MSWSQGFISGLGAASRSTSTLLFWLVSIDTPDGVGGEVSIGSHPSQRADFTLIQATSISVDGGSTVVRDWTSRRGGFTLSLTSLSDAALKYIRTRMPRGTTLELRAGFVGDSLSDYEPIGVGMLLTLQLRDGALSVRCQDPITGARGRLTTDPQKAEILGNVGSATTVDTAPYVSGTAPLVVLNATGFEKETGSGFKGLLSVEGDGGDNFFLKWSGISGTPDTFTVDTSAYFGTTLDNAAIGNAVTEYAYTSGHPFDVMRKYLLSTGAGTNGAYDTLPEEWGGQLSDTLFDHDDIAGIPTDIVNSAGTYQWDAFSDVEQSSWDSLLFSPARSIGILTVLRQGRITFRGVQDPNTAKPEWIAASLGTSDILVGSVSQDIWDPAAPVEYAGVSITTGTTAGSYVELTLASLPIVPVLFRVDPNRWTNEAVAAGSDALRIGRFYTRIPSRVSFQLTLQAGAPLCQGDIVELTHPEMSDFATGKAYKKRRAFVTSHRIDWAAGAVSIICAVIPEDDA